MIQHFQYKSLYKNEQLPGWIISFYFDKERFEGTYHSDGRIEWSSPHKFKNNNEERLKNQIHELMLYHVYDKR